MMVLSWDNETRTGNQGCTEIGPRVSFHEGRAGDAIFFENGARGVAGPYIMMKGLVGRLEGRRGTKRIRNLKLLADQNSVALHPIELDDLSRTYAVAVGDAPQAVSRFHDVGGLSARAAGAPFIIRRTHRAAFDAGNVFFELPDAGVLHLVIGFNLGHLAGEFIGRCSFIRSGDRLGALR